MSRTVGAAICNKCHETLPIDRFHRNAQSPSGRHPWCKDCKNASQRQRYATHHEEIRAAQAIRTLKHKYGMTPAQLQARLDSQNGVCAICGCPPKDSRGARLCVDHDHTTGQLRGLLCTPCNLTLGYMNDDPQRLLAAVAYLRSWSPSL